MRMIACQTCRGNGTWVVFDSVIICDTCRLAAISSMRVMGFLLSHPHPFTDELTAITGKKTQVRVVK